MTTKVSVFFSVVALALASTAAMAQPANDGCENPESVAVPSVTSGTTIGATNEFPAPGLCGTSISSPGVWYAVTGTGNTMTASTCNDGNPSTGSADYDSKINVYCEGCATPTCVTGQDDDVGCLGFSTKISWPSLAGVEYKILVQGFFGDVGNFNLAILDDGVPASGQVSCGETDSVDVDLKPGSCPNCVRSTRGRTAFAFLSSDSFDATAIDQKTAQLAFNGSEYPAARCSVEDVNYDGLDDVICHAWAVQWPEEVDENGCGQVTASALTEDDGVPVGGSDVFCLAGQYACENELPICAEVPFCGNYVIDEDEECDMNDTPPCVDLGFDFGETSCNDDCTVDTSFCELNPVVGACLLDQCAGLAQSCVGAGRFCEVLTLEECQARNGEYQGDHTACVIVD